jgi:MerR family transcriptional regulator, copper efflux regulator
MVPALSVCCVSVCSEGLTIRGTVQVNVNMKSSSSTESDLTIGQLADRFGLPTHVLRHWESMGLLSPAGRVNGRRHYSTEHLSRVAMILRGKEAGFSLVELRLLLDAPDRATRKALFSRHHADLERRIADMEAAKEMIEHALECPAEDATRCPDFQRLVASRIPDPVS